MKDREKIPVPTFRIRKLLGRMLGLQTPGGLPPGFEYRPLLEALESSGKIVVGKIRGLE
jgi:hypothetical protein